jgi:hypothetical protein
LRVKMARVPFLHASICCMMTYERSLIAKRHRDPASRRTYQ